MSDPTASPTLIPISPSGRARADPPATPDDDAVMDHLATWLAEVSAEAALQPTATDVEPTAEAAPP